MRAGRLDRKIELQRATNGRSERGDKVPTFTTYETVPANIKRVSAKEIIRAGQVTPEFDVVATIRYRSDVSTKDRFLFEGLIYNILGVTEIGRREGLELMAKGAVPAI